MNEHAPIEQKTDTTKEQTTPKASVSAPEQPNKGYSFTVGIVIGLVIIIAFVLLFPN